MIQVATPAQATALQDTQKAEGAETVQNHPSEIAGPLASHIQHCFEEAVRVKNNEITMRLLACQRLRRGKYSPDEIADIEQQGGSDVFVNLTNIKCRAAESWIKDVMFNAGGKAWALEPTEIPSLPANLEQSVLKIVQQEQLALASQGEDIHDDAFHDRTEELREEVLTKLREIAKERSMNMELKIADEMDEGKWDKALSQFINDFTTFPCAFLKGPVPKTRKRVNWTADGTPLIEDTIVQEFNRVSPFDIYPAPDAVDIDDAYLIERQRLFAPELEAMKGMPGYSDDQIDMALDAYGESGYVATRAFDQQRDALESRPITGVWGRHTIEALQYWGSVKGSTLKQWAGSDLKKLGFDKLDDNKSYEIEAWLVGSYVIKAVLNPDRFGQRPYTKAMWDEIPGAFWGTCPPEIMEDIQRMINATARALANNLALASGPQVEVLVDRLPKGTTDIETLYPWKVWQATTDKSGGGQRAVNFFQPNSNAQELQLVMEWYYKKADEVTGIPNYTYGSSQVSGAGRTASGLSMLMEQAAKGIKQAISNIDFAVTRVVTRMYMRNMMENNDPTIKGDCRVIAKGTLGLIQREAVQQKRQDFLTATTNPIDAQIMGAEGRGALLRELAKGLQMDVDKIVPSPEKLKAQQQQMMDAQQQAAMAQQQGAPGEAPPGPMQ